MEAISELRITPAYAGKRPPHPRAHHPGADHPRLRGEKSSSSPRRNFKMGSPPPTRGKVKNGSQRLIVTRITPAYAGKRNTALFQLTQAQDHPRLRGEKRMRDIFEDDDSGSPPPTRGKVPFISLRHTYRRITPAYAGKRSSPI